MTLEVVQPDPEPREIVTADTDSWIAVASDVIKLATLIAPTEFVPRSLRDSAPATAAAILYGREVGLAPMTALTQTHVIDGRPAMSAEGMRAMVFAAGHEIDVVESTRGRCEIRGRRHGREKWTSVVWTIDEVKHLLRKDNWQNYPRQMLQARASAELCRLLFPDVIHGFRATEEFDDLEPDQGRPEPAAAGTKVARKRATAAAAPRSLPAPAETRPEPATGPPLPGEAGYEDERDVAQAMRTSAGDSSPMSQGSPVEAGSGRSGDDPHPDESPADAQTTDTDAESTPAAVAVSEELPGEGGGEAPEPGDSEGGVGSEEPPGPGGTGGSEDRGPRMMQRSQGRMIFALLKEINGGEEMSREDRLDVVNAIAHTRVTTFNQLTHLAASTILDTLGRVQTREQLDALLAAAASAEAARWNEGDRS